MSYEDFARQFTVATNAAIDAYKEDQPRLVISKLTSNNTKTTLASGLG